MARTKLMVIRACDKTLNLSSLLLNREYGRKMVHPFKIKLTLPAQKPVTIKKKQTTCINDKGMEETEIYFLLINHICFSFLIILSLIIDIFNLLAYH